MTELTSHRTALTGLRATKAVMLEIGREERREERREFNSGMQEVAEVDLDLVEVVARDPIVPLVTVGAVCVSLAMDTLLRPTNSKRCRMPFIGISDLQADTWTKPM